MVYSSLRHEHHILCSDPFLSTLLELEKNK